MRSNEQPGYAPETALYRFYDAGRRLLYIGISGQPAERWTNHRRKAPWWSQAAYVSVALCPTSWGALDAERMAIKTENPLFNKRSKKRGA